MKTVPNNSVILTGYLVAEAEEKQLKNGKWRIHFALSVDNNYINDEGLEMKVVDFHRIVINVKKAGYKKFVYPSKGSLLRVEGKLANRAYEGKDCIRRYVTEIITHSVHVIRTSKDGEAFKLHYEEIF